MRDWTYWDWTGYSALFLSVASSALAEALRKMPATTAAAEFAALPMWSFLPLVLFLVGSAILFARHMGWVGQSKPKGRPFPDPYNPEKIISKKFVNATILVDEREYIGCEFLNCTYHYEGTTPVRISNSKFLGTIVFDSHTDAVKGAYSLAYALGAFNAELLNVPSSSWIERPTRV